MAEDLSEFLPIRALRTDVAGLAVRRFEELFRQLAADFPEVAFWADRTDHQATRAELRSGLAGLETLLTSIAAGRVPDERRAALGRRYRAELNRSVLRTGDVPDGLRIPTLGAAYIDHRFRVAGLGMSAHPDREDWWDDKAVRDDLYGYLAGHLTSPEAVRRPLLLLGQPGSGKSVLSKVLAARLPSADFLVVRVVLRETRADTDLQGQIESAVRDATGETLPWPDLARTADGALPVVLLDGFDELLQATGVSRSDYLEQIVRFQEREADQGRPVAVILTSRTAVADRVRVPPDGATAVRLEPFDDAQVTAWLKVWNDANGDRLTARGLRGLTTDVALAHRELAEQPLLLMMLALYDADENALQRAGDDLDQASLYERLLTRFAEREVLKSNARLDPPEFAKAVQEDLLRLSITAFAMFNRGRQWATETELNADLAALIGDTAARDGRHAPLSPAQTVVGRFFFVHQAQAIRDDTRLTTCEFLHATFGEFLIARLVVKELEELARDAERNAHRTRQSAIDDTFLRALLSFECMSARERTLRFLYELIARSTAQLRAIALDRFQTALEPAAEKLAYAPAVTNAPKRFAAYSANMLLVMTATGPVTSDELFPDTSDHVDAWTDHTYFLISQLPAGSLTTLVCSLATPARSWSRTRCGRSST